MDASDSICSCLQVFSLVLIIFATVTYSVCCVCSQAALDKTEGTAPSRSQPHSAQGVSDASNSDSTAGPRKLKRKKKAPVPAAQLLEDEGLNAELDAANAGGLVETERDRLIRTVSQLSTSTHAQGLLYYLTSCVMPVLATLQLQRILAQAAAIRAHELVMIVFIQIIQSSSSSSSSKHGLCMPCLKPTMRVLLQFCLL